MKTGRSRSKNTSSPNPATPPGSFSNSKTSKRSPKPGKNQHSASFAQWLRQASTPTAASATAEPGLIGVVEFLIRFHRVEDVRAYVEGGCRIDSWPETPGC